MIALSAVRSFAWMLIHNAILFIKTLTTKIIGELGSHICRQLLAISRGDVNSL